MVSISNPFGSGTSGADKSKYKGKGIVNLYSSLSEETHDAVERQRSEFGFGSRLGRGNVPMHKESDEPLLRSLHRAADMGKAIRRDIHSDLYDKFQDTAEMFSVVSPDGAGMTTISTIEPFKQLPLDCANYFLVVSPNPQSYERVCRAVNLATLEPNDYKNYLFLSKANHNENLHYPRKLARLLLTSVWVDSTNFYNRAVIHREIDPNGPKKTRQKIESLFPKLKREIGTQPRDLIGFDPSDWVFEDVDSMDVWADDHYEVYVRVPSGSKYDDEKMSENLSQGSIKVNAPHAVPVPKVQILFTRRLSTEFLDTVRTSGVRWLYRNAEEIDHWRECVRRERGWNVDLQQEVERFVTEELGVRDPVVQEVFEEEAR